MFAKITSCKKICIKFNTRWFKYDRDKLWLIYTQPDPVIFEPPCISRGDFNKPKPHCGDVIGKLKAPKRMVQLEETVPAVLSLLYISR
jgi:hypothetical protein